MHPGNIPAPPRSLRWGGFGVSERAFTRPAVGRTAYGGVKTTCSDIQMEREYRGVQQKSRSVDSRTWLRYLYSPSEEYVKWFCGWLHQAFSYKSGIGQDHVHLLTEKRFRSLSLSLSSLLSPPEFAQLACPTNSLVRNHHVAPRS